MRSRVIADASADRPADHPADQPADHFLIIQNRMKPPRRSDRAECEGERASSKSRLTQPYQRRKIDEVCPTAVTGIRLRHMRRARDAQLPRNPMQAKRPINPIRGSRRVYRSTGQSSLLFQRERTNASREIALSALQKKIPIGDRPRTCGK